MTRFLFLSGPPDEDRMQAVWIGGTVLTWGLVLAGILVASWGGGTLLGAGLLAAAFLVAMAVRLTYRWLIVDPEDEVSEP